MVVEIKTPWQMAQDRRSNGYMQQERRSGSKAGARRQLNSGRVWHSLRDVMQDSPLGKLLIDNKTTENLSYTIKKDDWVALKRDANRTPPGCHPALQIDIQDVRLMVTEERLWDDVFDYIRKLEGQIEVREVEMSKMQEVEPPEEY